MECNTKNTKMVATLQSRREAIEAKLREKTFELKKLCLQEAELTGILPPETPIEPGESPPSFRRRVSSTSFTRPPNLILRTKSRAEEKDTLAELENEYKIQTSISDAALARANDFNSSKSIRRKHRLEYQQSQRRLADLEARLSILKQTVRDTSHLKHRKKYRPPPVQVNNSDCVDGIELAPDNLVGHFNYTLPSYNGEILRNNHFYNSFGKSCHSHSSPFHHHWNRNQQYRRSVERIHHNSACFDENTSWLEDSGMWRNTAPPVGYFSNQCYTTLPLDTTETRSRLGSIDRRARNSATNSPSRNSPVIYAQVTPQLKPDENPILLPSQTYPENNLVRAQLLHKLEPSKTTVDSHYQSDRPHEGYSSSTLGRRNREKEWRETALDNECYDQVPCSSPSSHTPPLHPRASKMQDHVTPQRPTISRVTHTPPPPPLPPHHGLITTSPPPPPHPHPHPAPVVTCKSALKSPVLVETVPFESPKNHTVVEVGKWQPYREVSKPFEMSDFYKYSTKYRKSAEQNATTTNGDENTTETKVENTNVEYIRKIPDENDNITCESAIMNADSEYMTNFTQRLHKLYEMAGTDKNGNAEVRNQWIS